VRDEGIEKLAVPLRQRPALETLFFQNAGIADKGLASLFFKLGEVEFKQLKELYFELNQIGDAGCALLVSVLDSGKLPAVEVVGVGANPATNAAQQAVNEAVERATQRRDALAASGQAA